MGLEHQQCTYRLVIQKGVHPDIGEYLSYGIRIDYDAALQESFESVNDISDRHDLVLRLVQACNCHRLEPIHILNVVEDAILMVEKDIEAL